MSLLQIFVGCVVETGEAMDQSIMNVVVTNPILTLLTSPLAYRPEKRSRNIFSISKGYVIIGSGSGCRKVSHEWLAALRVNNRTDNRNNAPSPKTIATATLEGQWNYKLTRAAAIL